MIRINALMDFRFSCSTTCFLINRSHQLADCLADLPPEQRLFYLSSLYHELPLDEEIQKKLKVKNFTVTSVQESHNHFFLPIKRS